MGRAKSLLRIGGCSFLQHVVHSLRAAGCDPVVVTTAPGDEDTTSQAEEAGAVVLTNPEPGDGPITSLRLVLSACGDALDGIVYLPVDHPLVRPETVRDLLDAARSAGAPLAVPMYGNERGHPAYFGRRLFAELADPDLVGGARTVVRRHLDDALLVDVDDRGVVTDIDTPDAYEAALAACGETGDVAP